MFLLSTRKDVIVGSPVKTILEAVMNYESATCFIRSVSKLIRDLVGAIEKKSSHFLSVMLLTQFPVFIVSLDKN